MKNTLKESIKNAQNLIRESFLYQKLADKKHFKQISSFIQNKKDKMIIIRVLDRGLRSTNNYYSASYLVNIFKKSGVPKFFAIYEKLALYIFIYIGKYFYFFSIPLVKFYIIKFCSRYILFGNEKKLIKKIKNNQFLGFITNVNRMGEALLGEKEAQKRIDSYISDLENSDIHIISIKISTIYSQITAISHNYSVNKIVEKLTLLYKVAKKNTYLDENGNKKYKLINLDMEEYRDMRITVDAFIKTLDQKEFSDLTAGIALQAYIADSYQYQQKITEWAKKRVKDRKAHIRIRIVKGANMDMEKFEALETGWNLTTYLEKHHTDANYKRMICYALEDENIKAVNLGIASHNLYDISYVKLIAEQNDNLKYCYFEMLQGMNDNIARMLVLQGVNIMIYLPYSNKSDFISTISYLIRRLDENTSNDNYLRYIYDLKTTNLAKIEKIFKKSLEENKEILEIKSNREKNRLNEEFDIKKISAFFSKKYIPTENTDFYLDENRKWLGNIKEKWEAKKDFIKIPIIIAGEEINNRDCCNIYNHNNDNKEIIAKFNNANSEDVARAISVSLSDPSGWRDMIDNNRLEIIAKAGIIFRKRRGDIMAVSVLDVGKIWTEADVEVSEAIDFIEYYTHSYQELKKSCKEHTTIESKGVGIVISPWNFPIAISCGGIVASLVTGNTVIFKPSNLSIYTGYEIAKVFWDAGVPKSVLQFIPSNDSTVGKALTKNKDINYIIFTGSTQVALSIFQNRPEIYLAAETGGKNITYVGKSADLDQVIKDVCIASFMNSGQKCSATSVLLLQEDIFNNKMFLEHLKDAVSSMKVGSGWDNETKIGPIAREPNKDLKWALTELDEGEEWLLKPKQLNKQATLWSPAIKIGSKVNSKSHLIEFFGPVITIMKAKNISDAITIINSSEYGLTSGIQSLDDEEIEIWKENIDAGNLYINRSTTGAIVLRQPFGGMKSSSYGAGIKAGGANYLTQFVNFTEDKQKFLSSDNYLKDNNREYDHLIKDIKIHFPNFIKIAKNYINQYSNYFSKEIDYFQIRGQHNICRFKKLKNFAIRIENKDSELSILSRIFIANIVLDNFVISTENITDINFIKNTLPNFLEKAVIIEQSEEKLIPYLEESNIERIRYSGENKISQDVFKVAAKKGIFIVREKVFMNARLEILKYLQEQSISHNYHRYGYIY